MVQKSSAPQTDKGFPSYTSKDTFLFGGEELVPLSNADRDWRCENESGFQRFRIIDSNRDGIGDAWEMRDPDGTRHLYGQYRGGASARWSAIEHPDLGASGSFDRTYCWMLDTTIDLHGNRIEYEYAQGTGVLYPSRITYSVPGNHGHEVSFRYETRPDAFDDYRPTFSARWDKRLTSVTVRTDGLIVRSYDIAYQYEPDDLAMLSAREIAERKNATDAGPSLLKRVAQRDSTGKSYLPPLIFAYSMMNLTASELRSVETPPTLDLASADGRVQIADVDSDSLPDLFATPANGVVRQQKVCLNRGEVLSASGRKLRFSEEKVLANPTSVDLANQRSSLADQDGDGLADFLEITETFPGRQLNSYRNRARLEVLEESRLGFEDRPTVTRMPSAPGYVGFQDPRTRQIDLNFDKSPDFLSITQGFPTPVIQGF